jgi:hypothetical protein
MATFRSREYTADKLSPANTVGKAYKSVRATFSITAAASNIGDVYVLAGPLQPDTQIINLVAPMGTPALTSASDNDFGFYTKDETGAFVEVDKDIIVDGATLASAITDKGADIIRTLNAAYDTTKTIGQFLNITKETAPVRGLYFCITTNVANTATGPVILDLITNYAEATNA